VVTAIKVLTKFLICFSVSTGPFYANQKPDHIRLHGTIESQGIRLNLSVATKEQKKIRAVVHDDAKSVVMHIVFNQGNLYLRETHSGKRTTRLVVGDEAATNLVDLLALNPDYHFRGEDSLNLGAFESAGYSIELKRAENPIKKSEIYPPTELRLRKKEGDRIVLLRIIKYLDFHDSDMAYLQPKCLEFKDHQSGDSGTIKIDTVGYNPGLPDFLFEINSEDTERGSSFTD